MNPLYPIMTENQASYKNDHLRELTARSLSKLKEKSLPTRRDESWKYTNFSKFIASDLKQFSYPHNKSIQLEKTDEFFILNLDHSSQGLDLKGLQSIGLKTYKLDQDSDDNIYDLIEQDDFFTHDILNSMSQSSHQNTWVVELLSNTSIDKPLQINHRFESESQFYDFQFIFLIHSGSKIQILENFESKGERNLIHYKSHCLVEQNAHFEHIIYQNLSFKDHFTYQLNSKSEKNSHYNNILITKGAAQSRSNLYVNLAGEQAVAHAHGLYILQDEQHHDTMSFIRHLAPYTYSHQLYKGVLSDKSRGIFTGRVRVEKDAQKVDANQLNKNLLLGDKAHANSRPQMEIYADDVKCAHGSTTGQISAEELFYFQSRGVSPQRARKILANAYANDVLLKIENKIIRESINQQMGELEIL